MHIFICVKGGWSLVSYAHSFLKTRLAPIERLVLDDQILKIWENRSDLDALSDESCLVWDYAYHDLSQKEKDKYREEFIAWQDQLQT